MKVFESEVAFTSETQVSDRLHEGPVWGMRVVFGEEDWFEKRYCATISFEKMGLIQEEAAGMTIEELDDVLERVDLEPLKENAAVYLFKDLYPDFDSSIHTQYTPEACGEGTGVFLKECRFLPEDSYFLRAIDTVKENIVAEIRACELLRRNPHPNIATYLGCRVQGKRVTGIYMEYYEDELQDPQRTLDLEEYVSQIRSGVEHLHRLGLCHNDLTPYNIMLKNDGTPVVIDFDACRRVGEKVLKRAPAEYSRGSEISEKENDLHGVKVIGQWIRARNEMFEERAKNASKVKNEGTRSENR